MINYSFLNVVHILLAYTFLLLSERTATIEMGTKTGLIKFCLGSICLLAVYLIWLWLCPLNLTGPLSQPLLRALWGRGALRDTVKRVTRPLMAKVMRGSFHFREVQESHKASGGIYKGERKAKAKARRRGVDCDAVYVPTPLKATNLEKAKTHTHKNTQKYAHECDSIETNSYAHNVHVKIM